jgi:hypothetical protein
MATLNQSDTTALQDAQGRISSVAARLSATAGLPGTSEADRKDLTAMAESLKKAKDSVHTVVTMKGYYPS